MSFQTCIHCSISVENKEEMILISKFCPCFCCLSSAARRVWKNYLPAVNGVVFLVDCADHERLAESKVELDVSVRGFSRSQADVPLSLSSVSVFQALLSDETISSVPVLVLGNKIDRPEAVSEKSLREVFALDGQTTGKVSGSQSQTHYQSNVFF